MMYLCFDLETGGFDMKNHTITEAYFSLWDENWQFVDEVELLLKNDQGEVFGTEEAFKITGIDPVEHLKNPMTVTYTQGREELLSMLGKYKTPKKKIHYRFVGQNIVAFDIPFMKTQNFLSEEQIKKAGIAHNSLDSTQIITWLKDIKALPDNVGSISSMVEFFGLNKGVAHRAKDDVIMQKEIYLRLCDLFKKSMMANLSASNSNSDLLRIIEI